MPPRTQRRPSNSLLLSLVGFSIAICGTTPSTLAGAQEPSRSPARSVNGQAAIDALGSRLPEVATAHHLTPAKLRDLLARDRTLHLTDDDQLLYVDMGLTDGSTPSLSDPSADVGTLSSPESTFVLHSRPGAAHTIYLDFDGHVTQGTRWNTQYGMTSIVSPSFDTDGDPSSFSSAERTLIQQAWDGVAEDFRPFDVDVTTEDPGIDDLRRLGAGDAAWGIRVVFSTDFTGGACQCGGMAFLGYFTANSDTPVFVFSRSSLAEIIDAASHEVGHSLMLHHDGSGTQEYYAGHGVPDGTSWGTIMGGAYQRLVTQWSKGEYTGANNAEDDLSIITTFNGFGFRPDDHTDDATNATSLALTDAGNGRLAASGSGVIGAPSGDVDVFTFVSGAGSVNLTLRSDPPSGAYDSVHRPNLNLNARLYDSNGALVASGNGVQTTTLSATVPAGRYSLEVTGSAAGAPFNSPPSGYSRYGSLGSYDIAGTFPATPCPAVLSIDPAIGPVASKVTITGSNLAWVRAVTFGGGVGALFKLESSTRITATIPAGAESGPVTLTNDPYCTSLMTKPVTICSNAAQPGGGEDGVVETCTGVVSVDDTNTNRVNLRLAPNPMVQESTIRFELPRAGLTTVRILDPAGRLVRQLHGSWSPAGPQQLRWDGRDQGGNRVNAGVYFVVVDGAGGVRERVKLAMLR